MEIILKHESELKEVARQILSLDENSRIFLVDAPMGAGKTTLIKQLCKELGSNDNFGSPSYSIVNEYSYSNGKIYHFDLYRLKSVDELFDLGIEEYLDSGNYCFFEWPDLIEELIKISYKKIKIEVDTVNNIRYIRITNN
jgi:tRNA threonylcarbamoyladenosine biosynthesis protein TsaE